VSVDRVTPYTLRVAAFDHGFFANFVCVMSHLVATLDKEGCKAVTVDWHAPATQREFPYVDPTQGNLWDLLFEPLDFPDAPATCVTTQLWGEMATTGPWAYRTYKSGSGWRETYHAAYRRHVRLRESMQLHVDELDRTLLQGARVVGVHIRHPDKGELPRHQATVEDAVAMARQELVSRRDRVFLATDHVEAVERFREAFGPRLVLQEGVHRRSGSDRQAHYDVVSPSSRLAVEVLTDALLLSRCAVLVHQVSNLATTVGFLNPELKMRYCESRRDHVKYRVLFGPPIGPVLASAPYRRIFGRVGPVPDDVPEGLFVAPVR
jgi:hypothetical protein